VVVMVVILGSLGHVGDLGHWGMYHVYSGGSGVMVEIYFGWEDLRAWDWVFYQQPLGGEGFGLLDWERMYTSWNSVCFWSSHAIMELDIRDGFLLQFLTMLSIL
jgi:hypothetical protein